MVRLGDVCDLYQPKTITSQEVKNNGKYKVFGANGVIGFYDEYNHEYSEVTITCRGATCGTINYTEPKSWITGNAMVARPTSDNLNKIFLFHLLSSMDLSETITGTAQPQITRTTLESFKIPLPPMDIQKKIVAEIESVEEQEVMSVETIKILKNKVESLCLEIQKNYKNKHLKELAVTNPSRDEISSMDLETLVSFIDMASVSNDGYIATKIDKKYGDIKKGSYTYFKEGDIIIAKITPCMENGKCALAYGLTNGIAFGSSEFHVIRASDALINAKFLFTILNRNEIRTEAAKNMTGASGHRRVPIAFYERLEIPVPSLPEQQKIIAKIEKLEAEIQNLQKQQEQMKMQKEQLLKKYL